MGLDPGFTVCLLHGLGKLLSLSLWLKFCPVKSNKLIRVKPPNSAKHVVTASRCSPVLLS